MVTNSAAQSDFTSGYKEAMYESVAYLNTGRSFSATEGSMLQNNRNDNMNEMIKSELISNTWTQGTSEHTSCNVSCLRHVGTRHVSNTSAHILNPDKNGNFTYTNSQFHNVPRNVSCTIGVDSDKNYYPLNLVNDKEATETRHFVENGDMTSGDHIHSNMVDFNGNIDNETDITNNLNVAYEDKTKSSVKDDGEDTESEDRLYIHCDINQNNEIDNGEHINLWQPEGENGHMHRENVWRPWWTHNRYHSMDKSSRRQTDSFLRKQIFTIHANCLLCTKCQPVFWVIIIIIIIIIIIKKENQNLVLWTVYLAY